MVSPYFLPCPLLLLGLLAVACAQHPADDDGEPLFAGAVPDLRLELAPAQLQRLRTDPRAYAEASLHEDGSKVYSRVGVKLKGGSGSFRDLDDKPAFTLKLDHWRAEQRFHGLTKLHLDNAVQDPTLLDELLATELCRAAGVPAPRVTHARVWLGTRDLGLYVLKEGFSKAFLRRHFAKVGGQLYECGQSQDLDGDLELESGRSDDRAALKQLVAVCWELDLTLAWPALAAKVDIDALLTFVAMEQIVGHWDGYTLRHNNYRLYFEPGNDLAYFIPHGMDQTFANATASLFPQSVGMVAVLALRNPEWQRRYRERVRALVPLFDAGQLLERVAVVTARLQPLLQAIGPTAAAAHRAAVQELETRLRARAQELQRQAALPEPVVPTFDAAGVLLLTDWRQGRTHDDAELQAQAVDGERSLGIAVGSSGRCSAAWRTEVLLPRGRYELQALVRTADVGASADGKLAGARLRAGSEHSKPLAGSNGWQPLHRTFEVAVALAAVELEAELRAVRGQAWFQLGTLRLQRLQR